MSSLFIFGAGASFGSGPCAPKPPPLGSELFNALRSNGGVAKEVDQGLADLFFQDFEAGMDRFWLQHNTRTTELLREMARYFAVFEPQPGNLYFKLIEILGGCRKKVVLATTNYDLLIERAISRSGLLITYGGLPAPPRNISVLKLHGSCNFLPDLGSGGIKGIGFDLSNSQEGSVLEAPVRVARSTQEIIDFCDREDAIAPAVAMYHPTKRVLYCRKFVQKQQSDFRDSIVSASRIYVVGLRVHRVDAHIWEPLARSTSPIYYVGRDGGEFRSWAQESARGNAYHLAPTFEAAIPKIANQLH